MQSKAQIDQILRQKSDAQEIPGVVAVAWSATGDTVLTKTEDGVVRRWEPAPDASGTDERFVLSAQVSIGAEIDSSGTIRGLDASAWTQKKNRLRALGGAPRP